MDLDQQVIVIGAGPAGLSTAAELGARGVRAVVLERGDQVGARWADRYDGLRLNTSRRTSALPGAPFPRAWGQFPTRGQYLEYLHDYAARHGVEVETGVEVTGLVRDGGEWQLGTGDGPRRARHVVIATGLFHQPMLPDWARPESFTGELLHASQYRSPMQLSGKRVVVVGASTSGMEIAHQLATHGAAEVRLSVRTPPNILPREVNGVPGDLPAPVMFHLPSALVDRMLFAMQRRMIGDLSAQGLPAPTQGMMARQKLDGSGPAVVDLEVIEALRRGVFRCVPAVTGLDGDSVLTADGARLPVDAVVLCTGYTTGLADLVGELDVLDARQMPRVTTGGEVLPGLRFVGYVFRPGLTGYVGRIARRAAREIAATPSPRAAVTA